MYKLLIRKIMRDRTITQEEKDCRRTNVIKFWEKEGKNYVRLLKKMSKEEDISFENFFLQLGYWFSFKLLYEGKEPTIDNVIKNRLDIYELQLFMQDIFGTPNT